MSFYLDASVLVPLHVEESKSAVLQRWVANADEPLAISDLAAAEFASAISRLVRMTEVTAETAMHVVDDFDRWRSETADMVENQPVDIRAAARLVRQPDPKLLAPDAIHLATCRRMGLTLVTYDGDMAAVAKRLGIAIAVPA